MEDKLGAIDLLIALQSILSNACSQVSSMSMTCLSTWSHRPHPFFLLNFWISIHFHNSPTKRLLAETTTTHKSHETSVGILGKPYNFQYTPPKKIRDAMPFNVYIYIYTTPPKKKTCERYIHPHQKRPHPFWKLMPSNCGRIGICGVDGGSMDPIPRKGDWVPWVPRSGEASWGTELYLAAGDAIDIYGKYTYIKYTFHTKLSGHFCLRNSSKF